MSATAVMSMVAKTRAIAAGPAVFGAPLIARWTAPAASMTGNGAMVQPSEAVAYAMPNSAIEGGDRSEMGVPPAEGWGSQGRGAAHFRGQGGQLAPGQQPGAGHRHE
jgi:hypothetical protein